LLRGQLGAPFRVGLLNFEFLGGLGRRHPQPAEGGQAEQAGDRGKQNTAVNHDGLRATRIRIVRCEIRARAAEVTRTGPEISHFVARSPVPPARTAEPAKIYAPSPSPRSAGGGGGGRTGRGRRGGAPPGGGRRCVAGRAPAWRLASASRASRIRSLARARSRWRASTPAAAELRRPHIPTIWPATRPIGPPRPDQFERREQPPAFVAPQDAARDQLAGHRRGIQPLAAEAADHPQALSQLADLRHAVHGLADSAAPGLGEFEALTKLLVKFPAQPLAKPWKVAKPWKDRLDPARDGACEMLRPHRPVVSGLAHIRRSPSTMRK